MTNFNEVVYVIMCTDDPNNSQGDKWIQAICRDSLTADENCVKLNADDKNCNYYVEEHEIYG